ncbi:MAG: CaiB/BaiF CoA transferase family protein [Bacillota bacterium]
MGTRLPLEGLKVIDAATMMAAPWAATYLADYGAEVIKLEHPKTGDQSRRFGAVVKDVGVYWKSLSRNKKGVTLNLSKPEGKEIFLKLIKPFDVFIENFRPGTLEKWGLPWEVLHAANPRLIILRCSGFGQTGPYAQRGGFGTVAESMSGFASMNGYPDSPPTLPPVALADGLTSVFAALAIMIAVYERDVLKSGEGQVIDISLYEPLMRMMEQPITEYSVLGTVPGRVGNRIQSAAPRTVYQAGDGGWVGLSASSQPIAENVFKAIGRPDLITDERFKDNPSRVKNVDELDAIVGGWVKQHTTQEVMDIVLAAGGVVGPIYDIAQLFKDPHFAHRQSIVEMPDKDLGKVAMPNVVAKFSRTPGQIRWLGPDKGEHNREIYAGLGLSEDDLKRLKDNEVI